MTDIITRYLALCDAERSCQRSRHPHMAERCSQKANELWAQMTQSQKFVTAQRACENWHPHGR